MTATGAAGIRDSSKRTADSAGLNEGGRTAGYHEGRCAGDVLAWNAGAVRVYYPET
jgi:hypothetical protein